MRNRAFMTTSGELGFRHQKSTRDDLWCCNILLLTDFVEVLLCCSCNRPSVKRRHRKNLLESVIKVSNGKKCKYLTPNTKSWAKTKHVFVSTLFCRSNALNRAFITKTESGELGFRNRKSTRDDLLLTDVGVRFPVSAKRYNDGGQTSGMRNCIKLWATAHRIS